MLDNTNNNVYKDVEETIKECTKGTKSLWYPVFTEHSAMYPFSTENLAGYIKKLKPKDKFVLTVTASGDHLLNLVFHGTKNIDCFDINKNAYYMSELKISALKCLDYNSFLTFFTICSDKKISNSMLQIRQRINENPYVFDYNLYQKIRNGLREDCLLYWDTLYKKFDYDGKKLYTIVCISSDRKSAIINNDYLNNIGNYNKIKKILDKVNINYFCLDLLNLHTLNKKYDAILLSNIYDYLVGENYQVINEKEFASYIEDKLSGNLNDNGVIALSYQYHYKISNTVYSKTLKDIFSAPYKLQCRKDLDKLSYKKILVPSIIKEYRKNNEKDCLYLYSKKTR